MTDEREIRLLISDWRKGRATRTIGQMLSDGYVVVLAAVVFGAMLVTILVDAQGQSAACDTTSCQTARTVVPWAMIATIGALAASASRLFGPIVASAAEGFWLLESPLNRRRLLLGRTVRVVVGALVAGAALGALVATLTGSSSTLILGWAAVSATVAAAVVAASAAEQGIDRGWATLVAGWVFVALALAGFGVVIAVAAGWIGLGSAFAHEEALVWSVAVGAGVVVIVALALAIARLHRVRRADLVSGGELVAGMAGAAFALDFGLIRDMIIERRETERGQVSSRRGRRTGLEALVERDWQRLRRRPQVFVGIVAVLIVPYAMNALGFAAFAPTVSALALFITLVPTLNGLRVLSRTKGLARCLPWDVPKVRQAAMRVPAIIAGVWSLAAVGAMAVNRPLPEAIAVAVIVGAAGVIGAVRWVTVRPTDYGTPAVYTPMGALPPGLMMNLFAGIDVVVIITAPLVFNLPWVVSIVLAVICFVAVQGHFSMERLEEQQAQQKKLYEQAKAERARQR